MPPRTAARTQRPDLSLEREAGGIVCGIDEAGRGPLAGPVIAAAVILPQRLPDILERDLNDSKKLTVLKREKLFKVIFEYAEIGIGEASVAEIDDINIFQATLRAMTRAADGLNASASIPPALALVDGKFTPKLDCAAQAVIGGDGRSLSIAAASVIAKHHRDGIMRELAEAFPGYGWETNAGYGTATHLNSLRELGVTPHHRTTFAPVSQQIAANN